MQPFLHHCCTLIRIDEFHPSPACKVISCLPDKVDIALIQIVELAFRSPAPNQRRNSFDKLVKLAFAFTEALFSLLSVFDVCVGSVPVDDIPRAIEVGSRSKQKPAIFSIEPPQAGFYFSCLAS